MKLIIHELEYPELMTSMIIYKYIIELNGFIMNTVCSYYKFSEEKLIQKTFSVLEKVLMRDPCLNHRIVFDRTYIVPGIKYTKYEYKLDDTYIKDLLLKKKMEAIERDFT